MIQQRPVTFVRVFDIVQQGSRWQLRGRAWQTMFSFESEDGRRHKAVVHGHPCVKPGMSVIAVLRSADDWDSLLGWVDRNTGEIAGPEAPCVPAVMVAVATGAMGCIGAAIGGDGYAALAFAAATFGVLLYVRRSMALYSDFRAIQTRITQAPA